MTLGPEAVIIGKKYSLVFPTSGLRSLISNF